MKSMRNMESVGRRLKPARYCVTFATFVIFVVRAVIEGQAPVSNDWPQWRGPGRSGLSAETGLLREWPASGPPRVWSTSNLGAGFGSIAVTGDRMYVQGMRNSQSVVSALNRADGKLVWVRVIGKAVDNYQGPG